MAPTFSIVADPALSLVSIEMSGFFEPSDVYAFETARDAAHSQLRCKSNEHLTLVDMRDMLIQSKEAVAEFQRLLNNPASKSKRIAIVVSPTLARTQIKRAAERRDVKYFTGGTAEARNWLLAG
ncbi:STAS/SEC14 domain-containing protein [Sphingomonas sp. PB2P12]|uniref:STAS/SEC14 domain-containing protein n=1 Tax=Sphingomonas sandaracina TaxID=3096157 RepID=UPI002FC9CE3C